MRRAALLLGMVCFCCPGMFNALVSLSGGLEDQNVASKATATLYVCFAGASLVAPRVCEALGGVVTLAVGTLGYPVYAVALGSGESSWAVPAAAVNGVCAALLWTAQGVLLLGYAPTGEKGGYVGLFWVVFNLGGVFGGVLASLASMHTVSQHMGWSGYVAVVVVMLGGTALSLTLPSPPPREVAGGTTAKAARADGGFHDPFLRLLLPLWLQSNWFYTFHFSSFNHQLFSVRSAGANASLYWGVQMATAWSLGQHLDSFSPHEKRDRAASTLLRIVAAVLASWLAAWMLNQPAEPFDMSTVTFEYILHVALFAFWGATDAAIQCWLLWVIGQQYESSSALSRAMGAGKCLQSLGAAASWWMNSGVLPRHTQLHLNWVLAVLASAPAYTACKLLRKPVDSNSEV